MPLPRRRNIEPVCVPSGIFSVSVPSDEGHLDLAAERQRREVQRDFAVQIVAVALEERVLLHVNDDVEIAGGAALRAAFAFAVEAHALPGGNAGGNLHRQLALLLDEPGAAAGHARLGDDLARAPALPAGAGDREEPLLIAQLPGAAALRAGRRRRARAPRPSRDRARRFPGVGSGSWSRCRMPTARSVISRS